MGARLGVYVLVGGNAISWLGNVVALVALPCSSW
jgi:hypothetical protein